MNMKKSWEGKGRWGIERGECKKAKWQSSCVEMKTMIFVLLFVSSISAKILETIAIEFEYMYHERGRGGAGEVKDRGILGIGFLAMNIASCSTTGE